MRGQHIAGEVAASLQRGAGEGGIGRALGDLDVGLGAGSATGAQADANLRPHRLQGLVELVATTKPAAGALRPSGGSHGHPAGHVATV